MNRHKGFTIVELMVVIIVISILASIAIVSYNLVRKDAAESRMKAHLSQVGEYLVAHRSLHNGMYPAASAGKPVGASDIDKFFEDADSPIKPYRVSPGRRKFCMEVTSKTYADLVFIASDLEGDGTVETVQNTPRCPSSLSD